MTLSLAPPPPALAPDAWSPGLWAGVPHEAYHSGATFGPPRLSASIAKLLLGECPAAAFDAHPMLGGGAHRQATKETGEGTYLHDLLLGGGPEQVIIHADNYLTKAAQNAKREAIEAGKLPILAREAAEASALQGAIDKALLSIGVNLADFEPELTALWSNPGGEDEVHCKARLDLTCLGQASVRDLKFTRKLKNPTDWARGIEYRYDDLQAASNIVAIEMIHPELAGRISFAFVVCPMDPPFFPGLVYVEGPGLELARQRWARAEELWAHCLETGNWPGHAAVTWEPSPWALQKEFEKQLQQPEGT